MVAEKQALESAVRADGDLKLIGYIMAGHPDRQTSIEVGKRLSSTGIAALEIGIPYSDPLADGPVIQRAGQAALDAGMTVAGALEVAEAIAREGIPIVLMTYVNPVLAYDPRRFAADAAQAEVSGVIVPDLPAEESEPVTSWLRAAGLDTIFLVAPTSPDARVEAICQRSSGFVYAVTLTGITGARRALPRGLKGMLENVRRYTDLPVAAGFGISRPDHMRALRGLADAAVVGSAFVAEIDRGGDPVSLAEELLSACR